MRPTSLAAIFAHPDDETFSIGGTVARAADAGIACHLFCATDGDAGRASGVAVGSRAELGERRRRELREAARVLGFASVHPAGYPDGALGAVAADELIGEVVRFLRRHRPSVVVTFGPEGGPNTHRDHRAISRAATAAYHLAGLATAYPEQLRESGLGTHRPSRLYYVSWDPPAPDAEHPALAVPATTRVDVAAWLDRKRAAFEAHVTQHTLRDRFEQLGLTPHEAFALAAGGAVVAAPGDDLFADG
jgi:LmbE family N-acetylglucosaminyl deacetylase